MRAFTLVELLLALMVTTLIASAMLAMLVGVVTASRQSHDTRRATVGRQVAIARLGTLVRCSASVLACDEHRLVLWTGDNDLSGNPNLSELLLIYWDAGTSEIHAFRAPDDLSPALDTTYDLDENFADLAESLAGSFLFPGQLVLQHVIHWEALHQEVDGTVRQQLELEHPSGPDLITIISHPLAQVD